MFLLLYARSTDPNRARRAFSPAWFWLKPLVVRLLNKNKAEDARDLLSPLAAG
jgi:hypothetical protein